MSWSDDEFEALLRQFRPPRPRPLPADRRRVGALAAAVIVVAAVAIPAWYGWHSPADAPAPAGVSTPSAGGSAPASSPDGAPGSNTTRRAVDGGAPASTGAAALPKGVTEPAPALSSAPVGAAGDATGRRVRVGGTIRPPVKLVHVAPVYPQDAQAAGIAGIVILDIVIGEDGSVIETSVVQSIPELDQAAIDAVSQWQFEQTLLNGEPVEVEMVVTIHFTLSR
jgi:protein TonB